MKTYLLLALQLISALLFSQTNFRFADSTAQWNILQHYMPSSGFPTSDTTLIHHVNGDTVINGTDYQSIANYFVRRDSSNKVYTIFPYDTLEYLTYDFGGKAGDTLFHMGNDSFAGGPASCIIDSVDSVFIGHYRKRIHLTWLEYAGGTGKDVWIDGIGSLKDYLFYFPYACCAIPEHSYFELLCFFESEVQLYHNKNFNTCYVSKEPKDFRFADSTAQWNVLYAQYAMMSPRIDFATAIYRITKDTIVNQKNYQFINSRYFIRQDSTQKVFGFTRDSSNEQLLYDFKLGVKDSMVAYNILNNWPYDSIYCRVDSTGFIILDRARKVLFVNYRNNSFIMGKDIWVEGIGAIGTHFLSPGNNPQVLDGPVQKLLCFSENKTIIYHDSYYNTCFMDTTWNGVSNVAYGLPYISPNPATNHITITLAQTPTQPVDFALFDITGRMILEDRPKEQTNTIQLPQVAKGLYIYTITSRNNKTQTGKLLIE